MPSTCLQKEKNAIELDETLDSGCEQSAQNEKAAELMLKPCVRCLQLFELTLLTCIALKPQPRKSKPGVIHECRCHGQRAHASHVSRCAFIRRGGIRIEIGD
mmetsp:Transcript_28299/g.60821  ORF Transcript_28299/g.60821 Transcript_28299/m.60821 type:complete len:102 (-) Transcript_28299:136-441(-)